MKKAMFSIVLCLLVLVSNMAAIAVSAEDNYVDTWEYLTLGTAEYTTDTAVAYTAFHIEPTEPGKYIISCAEQKIGILSYSEFFIPAGPTAETICGNSVEWDCAEVGPAIIIAVESGDGSVEITVTREDLVQKEEIPWTIYENQVTPTAFTFSLDSTALKAVNTQDSVLDNAVLGEDGYYHLNAADGEILFAKLNDSTISLKAMIDYGQIKEVVQDENNNVLSKTDFNNAVTEYVACMDSKTGLYPLTVDLVEVFQRVGNNKNWYGASGFVGGELADAWMFACYYVDGFTAFEFPDGDLNADGKVDAADASALFYYYNGIGELADTDAADLNGDGVVNLRDVAKLFYMVNGLLV